MIDREEQQLDAVLNALAAAEPTPGMQHRILQHLDEQTLAARQPTSRRLWWSSSLAFAVAATAAIVLYWPHTRTAVKTPVAVAQGPTAPAKAPVAAPIAAPKNRTPAVNTHLPVPAAEVADRGAANLPSQPAPEAPLTVQERQLLRIAHHPDQADLALLNPQVREEIAHQSAADFERYFPKPTEQEIYLAEHANN